MTTIEKRLSADFFETQRKTNLCKDEGYYLEIIEETQDFLTSSILAGIENVWSEKPFVIELVEKGTYKRIAIEYDTDMCCFTTTHYENHGFGYIRKITRPSILMQLIHNKEQLTDSLLYSLFSMPKDHINWNRLNYLRRLMRETLR